MNFNSNLRPMTIEEVGRHAPSALAVAPHESRSARYAYIPTIDVIRGMEKAGFLPFKATQSTTRDESRREFTKHMIRFRHMDMNRAMAVGDTIPEIVLVNSHDGTSAYKLMAGLFRLVCSNGMIVADSLQAQISILHVGNVVEEVVNGSLAIAGNVQKAIGRAEDWSRLQLTSGEQNAFASAAHTLRFGDAEGNVKTPITASQLLQANRREDVGNDLWKTFNRVQENAIKGGLTAVQRDANGNRVRRVSSREVKGIESDVKLNRALWQLAERMAELKTAA